ncbi:MAG: hypothetical protein IT204_20710 [Fimbriimonadaceae bacterium]|nr:hypothetical protein [Fimbriimonadaceae bacterium]
MEVFRRTVGAVSAAAVPPTWTPSAAPERWVAESYFVACKVAYAGVPLNGWKVPPGRLPGIRKQAQSRLRLAGMRMAAVMGSL